MRYGKLTGLLATLALPIFIDTLLVMTLGAADTFMLSRYSDESVAAVGLVNVINILGNYALIFGKFGLPAMGVRGAAIHYGLPGSYHILHADR